MGNISSSGMINGNGVVVELEELEEEVVVEDVVDVVVDFVVVVVADSPATW